MSTYAIIDFETTGLSPAMGDRATEIAAVVVSNGHIVGRYQSLINPQRPIPAFVQSLTGITDSMVRRASEAPQVMRELFKLIGDVPLIAHNAAFDKQFLDAEYQRAGLRRRTEFACSMLVARRLYPNFANHKLGDLVRQLKLPSSGVYHRAMADAEMTAHLLARMVTDLNTQGLPTVTHQLLCELQRVPRYSVNNFIKRQLR